MVKTNLNVEVEVEVEVDHSKRKTDFFKEVVKNITLFNKLNQN